MLSSPATIGAVTLCTFTSDATGHAVDLGGYYMPDIKAISTLMRPSETFNSALSK